ncbi:chorismate-binding protein [Paracidovorax wautersii]|uniref:Para-aminobenzoate synthetase/4-amino-4-deoxychorismate lyase n=1 Tax=Paracidovorax wautersii TaxID=1177982 RepID=A0ABU1I8M9_9BURK|nr:chorismate-binding protein [Paracidovorax wautersii]MDR6212649.1 para-aminobenzoate synthetase/4-amino-4-deoxychorismate lyase [Paracidovorax wautersii]
MDLTALIDFTDPRAAADGGVRLRHAFAGPPQRVLAAYTLAEVPGVLRAVDAAARAGAWCVGGLRYEVAAAFDGALRTHAGAPGQPLAWFAVFDAPGPWPAAAPPVAHEPTVDWHTEPQRAPFDAALAALHAGIAAGEYYQVNYTGMLRGTVAAPAHSAGSAAGPRATAQALFAALQRAQPGGYGLYLELDGEQVLSASPELFFDWQDGGEGPEGVPCGTLLARPMKGTAPRGATPAEDAERAAALRASPKERAENVMIVDLLRNDLSRIATPHSVRVPALFHTQALPAVWQMTSDVQADTPAGTTLDRVFAALFPCGSITGAPKVRAMQAIHALEDGPRGWYCGALGVVRPRPGGGLAATFNVPIRTVELHGAEARCGIGSGITHGARADAEWQEWQHKRAFLVRASEPFDLLETLALVDGAFRHRAEHLARMEASAAHFNVPWDAERIDACLHALAATHPQGAWRARLLLRADGSPRAEAFALVPQAAGPVRLALAGKAFAEAHSEFVRHKTTRRAHYAAFAPAPGSGVFDTVLYNAAGEITETTFGNIAAQREDGVWVTPPLACGLLPGVGRAVALGEGRVTESVLRVDDVPRLRAWAFVNSLRGWLPAVLA